MARRFALFAALCTLFVPAASARAADQLDQKEVSVQERKNVRFKLPDDWPIEDKGSSVNPIPIEQYLALKFDRLEERLQTIEGRIAVLEKQVAALQPAPPAAPAASSGQNRPLRSLDETVNNLR